MSVRLNTDNLRLAKGRLSYEFIAARPPGEQWRIRDENDDAVGSAATQEEARAACERLNR